MHIGKLILVVAALALPGAAQAQVDDPARPGTPGVPAPSPMPEVPLDPGDEEDDGIAAPPEEETPEAGDRARLPDPDGVYGGEPGVDGVGVGESPRFEPDDDPLDPLDEDEDEVPGLDGVDDDVAPGPAESPAPGTGSF